MEAKNSDLDNTDFVELFRNKDSLRLFVEGIGGTDSDISDIQAIIDFDLAQKRSKTKLVINKNTYIINIIKNILIRDRMQKLGPNPTKEQREKYLNELREKIENNK
jgi:hypothetical protein